MKTIAIAMAVTAVLSLCALGAEPERFNNTICPVMGTKIPFTAEGSKSFIVHEGIRYEFCCPGCDATFKEDPAKCLAKLPNNGKIVDLGNALCPVMGGKVDKNVSVVYNGTRVHFCCPDCIKTFTADPEKYLKIAREKMNPAPEPSLTVAP
ncbi:YHS domain-containing protein [bacterium]|nr:YHS domain-containing protein [bacterium]